MFTCMNIYIACPLQHTAQLPNCSLKETCWEDGVHQEDLEETFYNHLTSFNTLHVTCQQVCCRPCMGVHQAMELIGNAKQAKSKAGWNQTNQTGGYGPEKHRWYKTVWKVPKHSLLWNTVKTELSGSSWQLRSFSLHSLPINLHVKARVK